MSNFININESKISVIGLGYVGLPLAIEFSNKFEVVGFDIDKQRVQELKLLYEDELLRAEDEDGSSNSTYISPKIYYPGIG